MVYLSILFYDSKNYANSLVNLVTKLMTSLLNKLVSLIKFRLMNSFFTFPNRNDWDLAIMLMVIFSLIVIPLGFKFNFFIIKIPNISSTVVFRLSLITLFFPAAAEELFFRVLLLPHRTEEVTLAYQLISASISLILFIIYHPLNANFLIRNARATFSNFVFLISTAILAIVCTIAYFKSGSIYPSIILHWIFVLVWLLVLGGYQRLHS